MCRFVFYTGNPIHLSSLITVPENSLIHQSYGAREREEPLNGDGFGMAWYTEDGAGDAALFRAITPAWNNQNLQHLARAIRSRCVLAHIRAASPGLAVSEANTHPFVRGRFSFMHNGEIPGFRHHRRALMGMLDEAGYEAVEGTTDSECLFALTLQRLAPDPDPSAEDMANALEQTIAMVITHLSSKGDSAPVLINAVLSNGKESVACRFSSSSAVRAASLHLHTGRLYTCKSGRAELVEAHEDEHSIIVASERLTDDDTWSDVPDGNLLVVDRRRQVQSRPIRLIS